MESARQNIDEYINNQAPHHFAPKAKGVSGWVFVLGVLVVLLVSGGLLVAQFSGSVKTTQSFSSVLESFSKMMSSLAPESRQEIPVNVESDPMPPLLIEQDLDQNSPTETSSTSTWTIVKDGVTVTISTSSGLFKQSSFSVVEPPATPRPPRTPTPVTQPVRQPFQTESKSSCRRFTFTRQDGSQSNKCYTEADYRAISTLWIQVQSARTFYQFHMDGVARYQQEYEKTGNSLWLNAKASSQAGADTEKQKMNELYPRMSQLESKGTN